jgi:CBS domain-containing protein
MKPDESPAVPLDSKISITPSDGMSPRDSISTLLLADPMHRIGHLDVARKKPLSAKPTTSIAEAITLMMRHEFSQLPVMISTRKVKGIFSWRSLAQKIAFQKEPTKVEDAMEEAVIIDSNCSLFEAAKLVADADCVLITDPDGTICGILTSYDLSVTFAERSEPFLLLEQIEKHVRNHLNQRAYSVRDESGA